MGTLSLDHGYTSRASRATDPPRSAVPARLTWPPALPFSRALDQARALDQSAVGMLYRRFLPVVYRFILARVVDPPLAEDLTSDTFSTMIERIATVRTDDELGFVAWLLSIARNRIAQHFRRRSIHEQHGEFAPDHEPQTFGDEADPLAILTARESWQEALTALSKLTEEQRTVVLYKCVLDYSTEEVAQLMNKRPGTIRALQFRGLASLARHLGITPRESADERRPTSASAPVNAREGRQPDAPGR